MRVRAELWKWRVSSFAINREVDVKSHFGLLPIVLLDMPSSTSA